MGKCFDCPRFCGADREVGELGFCRVPQEFTVAKSMLHKWEEPCISGKTGAGTIFFSGCNLGCIYCQNKKISRGDVGERVSEEELKRIIFSFCEQGAECIEFVTPTHYTSRLVSVLEEVKPKLNIPTVWNSGGYERAEMIRRLDGLVDVFLPDLKYFSSDLSRDYSHAPDYFEVAIEAVCEMQRITGSPKFDGEKLLSGTLIRHLVLPSCRGDSIALLKSLAERISPNSVIISLMSQYTPDFYAETPEPRFKNLTRRLTSFEYDSVLDTAVSLGFDGYFQGKSSADKAYTPNF